MTVNDRTTPRRPPARPSLARFIVPRSPLARLAAVLLLALGLITIAGIIEARRPVTVAHYARIVPTMACRARPLRVVAMSDFHVQSLVTPPSHIAEAVARANAQSPDLVVLLGDHLSDGWTRDDGGVFDALAPLGALRARLGTVAVLGNNDWLNGAGQIDSALRTLGVRVLHDDAYVTPELAVLSIEDLHSRITDSRGAERALAGAVAAAGGTPPPLTLFAVHDPDLYFRFRPRADLLLAGHTHGGQIWPDVTVPLSLKVRRFLYRIGIRASFPVDRYVRGLYPAPAGNAPGSAVLVTSGIGTSALPLRLGVPPEIAVIDFNGCAR